MADPSPPVPRSPLPRSIDEWAQHPREARLARLARTADDLGAAVRGRDAPTLTRRPDAANWAPIEVLCHLRDAEESFLDRFRQIMATEEPRFPSVNPNRVAEEREYLRQQSDDALAAFRRHREGSLAFFGALRGNDWTRESICGCIETASPSIAARSTCSAVGISKCSIRCRRARK